VSKGDDVWRARDMIVLTLYDEGAWRSGAAVPNQASFKKEMIDKAAKLQLDVTEADIEELFVMLAQEGLIPGWSGSGADPLWLTPDGFRLGREISARKGGEPYY
jgi:hypothetical protein